MCYSHSSAWLISRCPILAWLLSAQLVFLHRKSTFPQAEFSSIHDVLNPVSRAQHFTHRSRLAQRSPRSAPAGQGAGAWRSRAHAVLQSLGWLLTFAIGYFGLDHFGSSPLTLSQDNPPRALPFLLLLLFLFGSSGTGSDTSTQITGYQLPITHFCYLCSASIAL